MATLNSSIRLNDDMTAKLTSAAEAMDRLIANFDHLNTVLNSASGAGLTDMVDKLGRVPDETDRSEKKQREHNEAIQRGANAADGLLGKLKRIAATYLSMQAIKNVVEASDELAQNTSRIQMMISNFNTGASDAVIGQETDVAMQKIYASANNARGSVNDLMGVIARFGNNARDAFSSSDEVIRFAEIVQKQMVIAGASAQEAANAEIQLSQGLGSGVLRGQDLNSVFEQAPNLVRSIADYLDVPIGKIKEMAADGKLSAEVVKNAIMASADEVDARFAQMPMTFGQEAEVMKNHAIQAFSPVLTQLNQYLNSAGGQQAIQQAISWMYFGASMASAVLNGLGAAVAWVSDNWAALEPVVLIAVAALAAYKTIGAAVNLINFVMAASETVHAAASAMAAGATFAQTAAQYGLNAALAACPITWIVVGVLAAAAAILYFGTQAAVSAGMANSALGTVAGAVMTVVAVIQNLLIGLYNWGVTSIVNFYNMVANFAAAFGILFDNPVAAIKVVILSLFNYIVSVVGAAAKILDAVFGSNLSAAVSGFQAQIQTKIDTTIKESGGQKAKTLNASDYTMDRINYTDAFKKGADWGDGVTSKIRNAFSSKGAGDLGTAASWDSIAANTAQTADNTGKVKDKLDDTEEDIKYLCDIAERDAINRFTTAKIQVDMVNNNSIGSSMDLDGMVDGLAGQLYKTLDEVAEGDHAA